ncbi:MAG TPA: peptidase domain-containing ABC transporter [Burkholderiaceae bacterium]|nr:peptidase domain-containing ABC transporter [Burkholderiaceae bacterium]
MPRGDSAVVADDSGSDRNPPHRADDAALALEELLWLAGSICRMNGIAFDARLVRQRVAEPYTTAILAELLADLGLETRAREELDGIHPAVATLAPEPQGRPAPVLVVRITAGQVDFFRALDAQPSTLPCAEFARRRVGRLLEVRAGAAPPRDADAFPCGAQFGFGWFVPELLEHGSTWRAVLLASLAIQLLALGLPLMTQAIIDKVIVHRTESTLLALGSGLAMFAVFTAILTWIRQHLVLHTGTRIDAVLGAAVFRHLVALPLCYFQTRPTGVIAARLHGVEQIREFLSSAAVLLLLDLPFLSVCLAVMFIYSQPLAILTLVFLGAIVVASLVVSPLFQSRLNREFLLGARNQAFVTEYVAGIETVKSLQMEPMLARRFGDYLSAHLAAGFATRRVANTYQVVAGALEQTMTLSILVVGAWLAMQPRSATEATLTIGMLVAFQMFASRLSQPLMRLVGLWQQFQQAHVAVRRLGDLMNAPAEPYSLVPMRAAQESARSADSAPVIRFEAVAFRHGEDRPFLYEGLDLSISFGECVAITGPSGCGKSTLVKLLQGFHLPTRGRILFEGVDTRHLTANELRAGFGVVPQETTLFSGTVLDNLLLAEPHAGFEQVVRACRMAEVHTVIEQLPRGYQTEIGERGAGLSGGQKQRIAIARALLKRPRVLVFDEATSNLDRATAQAFARTVGALRGRVTVLFVTHAPTDGLVFDRVIRLGA